MGYKVVLWRKKLNQITHAEGNSEEKLKSKHINIVKQ